MPSTQPSTHPARRRTMALLGTLAVIAAAAFAGAAPAQAQEPQTYTYTYQCDPKLPGYGTNSSGSVNIPVNVGDTVELVFSGGSCREGSMHFRGAWRDMLQTTPAWSGSCCSYIPSGTVYRMKIANFSPDRTYGTAGWMGLSFFRDNYGSMNQVYLLVQPPAAPAPKVPEAPKFTSQEVYEDVAFLGFTAGSDGGSPITKYQYRKPYPAMGPWIDLPAYAWEIELMGLKMGQRYEVEIRAVNAVGAGPASAPISFRTMSLPPSAPTITNVDPEDGAASLDFLPGYDGGSPIVKYQYQLDDGDWVDAKPESDSSPVRIKGLKNYESYLVRLRAVNEEGEVSDASYPVWVEPGPSEVEIQICHWTGDDYEPTTTTDAVFRGRGDHAEHEDDIIPEIVGVGGSRNWDSGGVAIWMNGCERTRPADTDKDGKIDLVDTDDDGDGIPDASDRDDDGDGILDCNDEDYESKTDSDRDGLPDAVESDDDGDGIADEFDTDRNGDNIIDVTDPDLALPDDSDGDGTPDSAEGDKDGDCVPDAKDVDDNGDGVFDSLQGEDVNGDGVPEILPLADEDSVTGDEDPAIFAEDADTTGLNGPTQAPACREKNLPAAPLDSDGDGVPNVRDKDIDGDGIPNKQDSDADGDFVLDTRDGDANGDGILETKDQPLVEAFALPGITAGTRTVIKVGQTVAGQAAGVEVTCAARTKAKVAIAPAGDIAAPSSKELCGIKQLDGSSVALTVYGNQPTLVTVTLTAPATGDYRAFGQVEQVTVR